MRDGLADIGGDGLLGGISRLHSGDGLSLGRVRSETLGGDVAQIAGELEVRLILCSNWRNIIDNAL
jgi:hypothetical protein